MTKAQVQTVIDNFRKVLPMAVQENHLDMLEEDVNLDGYKCGTVHCHGGWYAVATLDLNQSLDFSDGATKMAEHLGFDNYLSLEDWAEENPGLWGNSRGETMFVFPSAFKSESRPEGAQNLQDIIDHWSEVQSRLTK